MDRATMFREIFRRLLLAAVLIQATTPDLLDLSLLSRSLPPGPVFAALHHSSHRIAHRNSLSSSEPDLVFIRDAESSNSGLEEESPERLCEPIWPEMALRQSRRVGDTERLKLASGVKLVRSEGVEVRHGSSLAGGGMTRPTPWLLSRLIC